MISIIITTKGEKDISNLIFALKKQCNEIIVEIDNEGNVSKSRNKGWKRAKGNIVIFIDDDVIVPNDFIIKGLKDFEDKDFGQNKVIGGIENSENKFVGCCMWFKKKILEEINGFDENFSFYNEDVDIYQRCLKKKFQYVYLKDSIVWHPNVGNFEKLKKASDILKDKHLEYWNKLKKEGDYIIFKEF